MLKKASKRLISAIIALVASVLLCIGVCLAWFAVNQDVSGNGLQTHIRGKDIIEFTVTAHYLDKAQSAETYSVVAGNRSDITVTVDANGNTVIDSGDVMRPYSLSNSYTTAVLLKIDYVLAGDVDPNKNFRIFAECPDTSRIRVEKTSGDSFKSNLSNAVKFVSAEADGSTYKPTGGAGDAFTNLNHEKGFHINFYNGINAAYCNANCTKNADGDFVGTEYAIMDYGSDRFAYLASLLLENGCGLNSGLSLTGDITFGMEEYSNVTGVPESIEVDPVTYNTDTALAAAFTQPVGSDIMSRKWQFLVTYSDGTKQVIVGSNASLDRSNINTQNVGKWEHSVTYTESSVQKSCNVNYTITPLITGGTGVAVGKTLDLDVLGMTAQTNIKWEITGRNGADEATINASTGELTAGNTTGTVTVQATVTLSDGTELTATSDIIITGEEIAVESITLSSSTLALSAGGNATLTATVQPTNATNKAVSWSSSKTSVATVDQQGNVVAVGAGTAVITASAGGKTATCTVTVTASTVAVTGVTLDKTTLSLKMGETTTGKLNATVAPANASNKEVSWSSDKTSVATVDSDGNVTAVGAGTATITVTTTDGNHTATCTVTVEAATGGETETVAVAENSFGANYDKNTHKITLSNGSTYLNGNMTAEKGTSPASVDSKTGSLKMESSTTITLTTAATLPTGLKIRFYLSSGSALKINEIESNANNGYVEVTLSAGKTYTISRYSGTTNISKITFVVP